MPPAQRGGGRSDGGGVLCLRLRGKKGGRGEERREGGWMRDRMNEREE
jgi:hypothetical protein